ncbi:MAG: GNAT family N-acetyltransferase [Acidimicrobiales bacterium]|nr:GNAT family N-acetyltransferase [Acidimicrobiales bacterium]
MRDHTPDPPAEVVCVVQARMGSTRLPGKVLQDLGGRPMLAFQLERLADLDAVVVVATSELARDDVVASVAADAGVAVVRGSETDVLDRFRLALDEVPARDVVRLTADCPLTDPEVVAAVVEHHRRAGADYTSNVHPRTFPQGLDVEVMAAEALRSAAQEATAPSEREHVTPFLYRHPERFVLANLRSGEDLGRERWTVDRPEDLDTVREAVAGLGGRARFTWREVLDVLGRRAVPAPGEVVLRPADNGDADLLLDWRNDPDTVRFSHSQRGVDAAAHADWFAQRLDDPACRLLVGVRDGRPVGTVRVDITAAVGLVSLTVAPEARGAGVGTALLRALVAEMTGDYQVMRLVAEVRHDNPASAGAFAGAGFRRDPTGSATFDRWTWDNPRP